MKVVVTTEPTLLIGMNIKRKNVILQNNGKEPVYVKKWAYGVVTPPVPSETNYDFVLYPNKGEGNAENEIEQIESISAYVGVTDKGESEVGVMETVKAVI